MPSSPMDTSLLDAKWLVIISAVAALAVVLGYDLRLGIAAGVMMLVTGFVWLLVALWFGGADRKASPVRVLSQRFEEQQRLRLMAEQRARELAARSALGAQQAAD